MDKGGPELLKIDGALCLTDGNMILKGDFAELAGRLPVHRLNGELLVRAAGAGKTDRELAVVDATAGLGEDSFMLAAAGCRVTLFERDPVIHALLEDALRRGAEDKGISHIIERMELMQGDSIEEMGKLAFVPHIVYLDPMFPERKKSGLVKKKFQLLHLLERPCSDENELLEAAVAAGPEKIIVKRPLKAEPLGGRKPTYSLKGKTVRYDCMELGSL